MTKRAGFLVRGMLAALVLALGATTVPAPVQAQQPRLAQAVLAGGCFWGMEGVFEQLDGVTSVVSGYAGGNAATAHYVMTASGMTGHAESVQVSYDPARISYRKLLEVFFTVAHDPTTRDRQGPDSGSQYRSAIFYANAAQQHEAQAEIAELTRTHAFGAPIVTQVAPLRGFYPAESYHQHYMQQHPDDGYIVANDQPKLVALRAKFPALVKKGLAQRG